MKKIFLLFPFSLFAANVLVTGGAGYIGSQTCKELAAAGHLPIVLDNLKNGKEHNVRWGPFIEGDIADQELVMSLIEKYNIEAIVHFAAYTDVSESVKNPAKYYENNTIGTFYLLEAARKAQVKNFIFSSTCAVYGDPIRLPIDETHPLNPKSPYGFSKLMSEQMIADYSQAYNFFYVIFRYFNAAGADLEGELGEEHEPPNHLIPIAFEVAKGERPFLQIFGTDYPTCDGTGVRDFISVVDLAKAHIDALDYLLAEGESTTLNLGTGRGWSVLEVVSAVEKITGTEIPLIKVERRAGDPAAMVCDPSKSHKTLGWEAHHSELEDMVKTDWEWQTS